MKTKALPAGTPVEVDEVTTNRVVDSTVIRGDISGLNPQERSRYYLQLCKSLGLNPATQPFAILKLNGKDVLYPTRGATDQLAAVHRLNREIIDGPKVIELAGTKMVYALCRATHPNGRVETAVATLPLTDPLNALMKCETKAKRRATLSILGLGMLDEMELETIPSHLKSAAQPIDVTAEEVNPVTGEVTSPEPVPQLPAAQTTSARGPQSDEFVLANARAVDSSLLAVAVYWVAHQIATRGVDFAQQVFAVLLRRLPLRCPKDWLINACQTWTLLAEQPLPPDPAGDAWEPNDRAIFQGYWQALCGAKTMEAIARVWIARRSRCREEYRTFWWNCACAEVANLRKIDCITAKKDLTRLVKSYSPEPPKGTKTAPARVPSTTESTGTTIPAVLPDQQAVNAWRVHLEGKRGAHLKELEYSLAKRYFQWNEPTQQACIEAFQEYLIRVCHATQACALAATKTAVDIATRRDWALIGRAA